VAIRRNILSLVVGVLLLCCLALVAFLLLYRPMVQTMPNPGLPTTTITIGTTTLIAEVASTEAEREQGLSDRSSLEPGHGMLFVFDAPTVPGFWMKDMSFSLDMLFADQSGKIVTIDSDLSPSTYLQNPPEVFYPSQPVLYVLEVPAGFAAQNGITTGMVMQVGQ
jgi:uncharacterized protein